MQANRDSKTVLVLSTASLLILWAVARMVALSLPAVPTLIPVTISDEHIDFGEVPLHGSVIRELVMRNDGEGALHARISVSGSAFQVSPEELVLYPGIESRVSIAVTAEEPGTLDDELWIRFDGFDLAPVVISLAGEAEPEPAEPLAGTEMLRA